MGIELGSARLALSSRPAINGLAGPASPPDCRRYPYPERYRRVPCDGCANLGSHKGPAVRDVIEAASARLPYLLPYSPDYNPIENAFAKLKAPLRKAAERSVPYVPIGVTPWLEQLYYRSSFSPSHRYLSPLNSNSNFTAIIMSALNNI